MISKDFWLILEAYQLLPHLYVTNQSSTLSLPLDIYLGVSGQRKSSKFNIINLYYL
jgi:hypothetical protein